MLNYIEYFAKYLNVPSNLVLTMVVIFGLMQLVGEFLSFKGKVVPAFMAVRTNHLAKKRKEQERDEMLKEATKALMETKALLNDVKQHYSEDNISKRDGWMKSVNEGIANNRTDNEELKAKLEETFNIALSTHIENQRNIILSFANRIADGGSASHEEFRRVISVCEIYEETVDKYNIKNGQVNVAYRLILEEYENRLKEHKFIENIRGYNL